MITREELRQLAEVEAAPSVAAVSFYFQPQRPLNKSHREEAILVKDLVRDALRKAERNGGAGARPDLERILALAEQLHGNHARGKAIFACAPRKIWQEFDLPPRLRRSELFVKPRFHLAPLAMLLDANERRCCVALLDREHARFFDVFLGQVHERPAIVDVIPRRVRSDGFMGYDAGHRERHVDNGAMHHYKRVLDQLEAQANAGALDLLAIGCHNENWPEIEPHLHPALKQRLLGWFIADPAVAVPEGVRDEVERLVEERRRREQAAMVREVIGEAGRNGRGSLGLKHVLNSLERGEVQRLLLGEHFAATVAECTNCGHLDTRMVRSCAICGHATHELSDVTDALVARAVRDGVQLVHVHAEEDFERAGNIAALLRFRADQNTASKVAG